MKKYILSFLQLVCLCYLFSIGSLLTLNAQTEMDSLSNIFYPDGLNDIWGYVDEAGNEYALVGVKTGVSIVDVTDATAPKELFFIEGMENIWRDLKTYQHYAYVVSEAKMGLQIIDLQNLPTSIDTTTYIADSTLASSHNIFIDKREGLAYLSGFNDFKHSIPTAERSIKILDLKPNPFEPVFVHDFINKYSHDAYVRDGILLSSEVYEGNLMIADVSNPKEPIVLATQKTPNSFTHNAWLSDNGEVVFTTDERNGAFVASYDISDLSDIKELDRYQSSPGQNTMPHNAHVINDFLVISYYNDGVVVVDAHEPDALVETEYYDTSLFSGSGSQGCWGAYPFLPSGNILTSDRAQGLFVLRPTYKRAAYVGGKVRNKETGEVISDVEVSIEDNSANDKSDFGGDFKIGIAEEGMYSIRFYKYGYETLIIENVDLETAKVTLLDVELQARPSFDFTIEVVDKDTGEAIEGAQFEAKITGQNYAQFTDETGGVNLSPFYSGNYVVLAYKWGWKTFIQNRVIDEPNKNLRLELQKMYHDDLWLNFGWDVQVEGDMAGVWQRGKPDGTFLESGEACNPDMDVQDDFGSACFVTGKNGGELEESDVDGGTTTLISPVFDLTDYTFPVLSFQQWFCSTDVSDAESDFVRFELMNGIDTVDLQTIFAGYEIQSVWHEQSFNVLDFLELTENMQMTVTAKGSTPNLVLETAIDAFRIVDTNPTDIEETLELGRNLQVAPNPFDGQTYIRFEAFHATAMLNTLQIFDSAGRLVLEQTYRQGESVEFLWGEGVEAGLYFVKFGEETRTVVKF
ncbi:MAG: choice-of-anchor B family protein [Chitinophagales bacterium]